MPERHRSHPAGLWPMHLPAVSRLATAFAVLGLSLLALVSTLALWRREQGPHSRGLDRPSINRSA